MGCLRHIRGRLSRQVFHVVSKWIGEGWRKWRIRWPDAAGAFYCRNRRIDEGVQRLSTSVVAYNLPSPMTGE